jgi:hypothetical protein
MVKTLGRKKSGPKAPVGGRVRVTVNLPRDLLKFVDSLKGRSRSDNIVICLTAAAMLKGK